MGIHLPCFELHWLLSGRECELQALSKASNGFCYSWPNSGEATSSCTASSRSGGMSKVAWPIYPSLYTIGYLVPAAAMPARYVKCKGDTRDKPGTRCGYRPLQETLR